MSTRRCNPHPIESDGTSRRQRAVAALDPAENPVDGRDIGKLIAYAERYATVLQFWNDANQADGDWQDFIAKDVSALLARISQQDIPALRRRFEILRAQVEAASGAQLAAGFNAIYTDFAVLATRLDDWYKAALDSLKLRTLLQGWIASSLANAMRSVVAQARQAQLVDPRIVVPAVDGLGGLWQLGEVLPDASMFGSGQLDHPGDQAAALEQLAQAHGQFLQALQQLLDDTPELLQESLQSYPEHQPHMALLLAFLQLFGHAQKHLNRLTAEHLKFYYRTVLGIAPAAAVADQVHLVMEPAKNLDGDPKIVRGSEFKAGKDASGVELIYASDKELVLNLAQLDAEQGLKSVYVALEGDEVKHIHAASDADSLDGLGADLEDADGRWDTFGGAHMPYADLGFAVASPMLQLAEGERNIQLRFDLDARLQLPAGVSEDDAAKELRHNIKVQGSGEAGWVDLAVHGVEFEDEQGPCLKFRLYLSAAEPALIAYNADVLDGGFATASPLLRFVLDNEGLPASDLPGQAVESEPEDPECEAHVAASEAAGGHGRKIRDAGVGKVFARAPKIINFEDSMSYYAPGMVVRHEGRLYRPLKAIGQPGFRPGNFEQHWLPQQTSYPYRYLQGLEVRGLRIDVQVWDVRNLILENDQGVLDPAKPFLPFGPVPKVGSTLLIGSPEVFSKQLDEVRLQLSWADLPSENFAEHYAQYDSAKPDGNQDFTAVPSFLKDGAWRDDNSIALFDDTGDSNSPPAVTRCLKCSGDALLKRNSDLGNFSRYSAGMRQGFMQLRLDSRDFGHTLYPIMLASAAIDQKKDLIPNAPYVPLVSELRLSYKAHQEIEFRGKGVDSFAGRVEQLFQIWPFGRREIWPIGDVDDPGKVPVERRLLPRFEVNSASGSTRTAEGTLYIGFKDLDLSAGSKNLSILVQVAEGSADPELPVQPVVWSYLADDVWHDFKTTEILADGSNGLLRSGIIRFVLPKQMSDNNQTLPSSIHWIRACVARDSRAVCRLIALHTQALTASLLDQGNDPAHLATPLAAGSIAKLKQRMAMVKKVSQPYASFGGRVAEGDDDFNVRVSERLRHKGRAITLFDYERLVLQGFPEIYKVQCVNHANRQQEHVAGNVRVIVVPDLRNRNAVDRLKPRASLDTLDRIHDYLEARASDFVALDVTNPDYEEIRIHCQVHFHSGYDQGYYLGQLVNDIQNFLSPWLHDEAADISFGGRIHRSRVLQFVEQQDYVDFVTDFRMDQRVAEAWCLDVEEAVASNASTVLVSAPAEEYQIGVDVDSCENPAKAQAVEDETQQAVLTGPRFLGNTGSRELHDLNNLTPLCHVDRIATDRQRRFYGIADARAMGYDLCGHCFGRDRSRR
jgi:hypothetical protein